MLKLYDRISDGPFLYFSQKKSVRTLSSIIYAYFFSDFYDDSVSILLIVLALSLSSFTVTTYLTTKNFLYTLYTMSIITAMITKIIIK